MYELKSTYKGFDDRGQRSYSSRSSLFFKAKKSAEAHILTVEQPTGYHGAGCSITFNIEKVVLEDANV